MMMNRSKSGFEVRSQKLEVRSFYSVSRTHEVHRIVSLLPAPCSLKAKYSYLKSRRIAI
ncbi:MAG: hypothetical protein F6K55_00405 [Moorea sp. SIO4A3]|nr:hypothetical protein [Moorena sp. SIO4A3]